MEEYLSARVRVLQSDGNYIYNVFLPAAETRKKFYDKNERFTFACVVNFLCFDQWWSWKCFHEFQIQFNRPNLVRVVSSISHWSLHVRCWPTAECEKVPLLLVVFSCLPCDSLPSVLCSISEDRPDPANQFLITPMVQEKLLENFK